METLVARGILAEDGFNPSGLKKGVTAKMTQYGQAALERTSAPGGITATFSYGFVTTAALPISFPCGLQRVWMCISPVLREPVFIAPIHASRVSSRTRPNVLAK